jgi:hypothetical protein
MFSCQPSTWPIGCAASSPLADKCGRLILRYILDSSFRITCLTHQESITYSLGWVRYPTLNTDNMSVNTSCVQLRVHPNVVWVLVQIVAERPIESTP